MALVKSKLTTRHDMTRTTIGPVAIYFFLVNQRMPLMLKNSRIAAFVMTKVCSKYVTMPIHSSAVIHTTSYPSTSAAYTLGITLPVIFPFFYSE